LKTLSHLIASIIIVLPIALSITASAQTVYRCANQYSHTPCENGTPVRTDDARDSRDRKAHQSIVKQEKKTADALERQRLKDEQAAHQAAVRSAEQEDLAARQAERREMELAAKKKKATQPHKIKAYATPKPAHAPAAP
jgi:hypothetical protein